MLDIISQLLDGAFISRLLLCSLVAAVVFFGSKFIARNSFIIPDWFPYAVSLAWLIFVAAFPYGVRLIFNGNMTTPETDFASIAMKASVVFTAIGWGVGSYLYSLYDN